MIPALVISGVALLALMGRSLASREDRSNRVFCAAILAGAGIAVALVAVSGLAAPFSPWDTVRLAPAMALTRGIDPYASSGSGAVLSTMYGPVAMAAFIPVALVPDAAFAAMLGRWIAFAFCMVPLVLVCLRSSARSGNPVDLPGWLGSSRAAAMPPAVGPLAREPSRGHRRCAARPQPPTKTDWTETLWRIAVLVSATLAMVLAPSLQYSTTFLHADAPALGLTGLACILATQPRGPGLGAAVACVLAVWTKQTLAPLPLILLAIPWMQNWESGRMRMLMTVRFGLQLAVVGVASLAIVVLLFDFRALYFNLVQVPGGVPWRGRAPWNIAETSAELALHAAPFLLAWLVCSRFQTSDENARRQSQGMLLVALALAPMAVLGRVKQAGDLNSFSPALYPLLLAVAARTSALVPNASFAPRRLMTTTIAALSVVGALTLIYDIKLLAKERPRGTEAAYLSTHPGTIYFPWNPSVHLAVEGRPTHHLFSAWERGVAGFPVTEAHLRSALPAGCRYVAFPLKRLGPVVGFGSCFQILERFDLLAQPAVPVRLAGLPDYECYALAR